MSFFILFLMTLATGYILVFLILHSVFFAAGVIHRKKYNNMESPSNKNLPLISVLIPVRNEEKVLGRLLESFLVLDYPLNKLQIIVINDYSQDKTSEIINEYRFKLPFFNVINLHPPDAHQGKAYALNRGLRLVKGKYTIVYDADNYPYKNSLKLLVNIIENKANLAAVYGIHTVENFDANLLTRFIELEIYFYQLIFGEGRGKLLDIYLSPGTNCLYRTSALKQVKGWDEKSLAEDTEISLRFYKEGYDMFYCPQAVATEQEPQSLGTWIRQRTRWFRGNLYTAFKYLKKPFQLPVKTTIFVILYQISLYTILVGALIISFFITIGRRSILSANLINFKAFQFIDTQIFIYIWILAAIIFYLQILLSKYFAGGSINLKDYVLSFLFYILYAPLWLIVVIRGYYQIIKKGFSKNKKINWEKTKRY